MSGLIKKDLMILSMQAKMFAVIGLVYAIMGILQKNTFMMVAMVVMVVAVLPVTSMGFDEQAKWDRYALTMPVSRKQLVASKYLLTLLMAAGAALFAIVLSVVIALINKQNPLEAVLGVLVSLPAALFFVSLLLPIVIKLGVEKARIAMLAVYLVPMLIMILFFGLVQKPSKEFFESLARFLPLIGAGFVLLMLALFAGSYLLAVRFAQKKEY